MVGQEQELEISPGTYLCMWAGPGTYYLLGLVQVLYSVQCTLYISIWAGPGPDLNPRVAEWWEAC